MMMQANLSRRGFIRTLADLGKAGLVFKLFPLGLVSGCATASRAGESMTHAYSNASLEEIVANRIHHGQGRFLNPLANQSRHSGWQLLKWKFFSENEFKQNYADEPVRPVTIDWGPAMNHAGVSVTFINHASLYIKAGNTKALIDPVFFGLPGFIKDFTPLSLDGRPVPDPDLVLVSHGHYDHMDKESLRTFAPQTHVVTPLGYDDVFGSLDLMHRTQLDWLDTVTEGDMKITLLPCNHWTMRNPFVGPNTSLWGSFLIETAQGPTIYVSGDTAYFTRYKELGERYAIDLAIFNLGAYEPRWFMAQSHINPRETVQAFSELKAKKLMAVHWGTFRLGDEPVHFPPMDIRQAMQENGLEDKLISLDHGRSILFEGGATPDWHPADLT